MSHRHRLNRETLNTCTLFSWNAQKYADVAFNVNQKAVLTTCVLKTKPRITSGGSSDGTDSQDEEYSISCCFSFTIRRDAWGTPSMIVGNFIKC